MHLQRGEGDESGMNGRHTKLLPHTSRPPIGANMMPVMKSVGRTVFGVSIGCHALRRCCLNAVSRGLLRSDTGKERLGGKTYLRVVSSFPSPSYARRSGRPRRRRAAFCD
jgi:hypothetical protein